MKEILERNSEAVREAGQQLVEIGAELNGTSWTRPWRTSKA